jgi:hypothetical protein
VSQVPNLQSVQQHAAHSRSGPGQQDSVMSIKTSTTAHHCHHLCKTSLQQSVLPCSSTGVVAPAAAVKL